MDVHFPISKITTEKVRRANAVRISRFGNMKKIDHSESVVYDDLSSHFFIMEPERQQSGKPSVFLVWG